MSSSQVQRLSSALHDWESQYLEVHDQLTFSDVYMLWLGLFRLSRRLVSDYNALVRGRKPRETAAYTGETQRLV